MDERELTSAVDLLMSQLGALLEAGTLPGNAQVVLRPVHTWPDGRSAVWVVVNCPN